MTDQEQTGTIVKVSGPVVIAKGMKDAKMYDVVRVSDKKLIGEIIELNGDEASIQVYEETSGVGPGELVYMTGAPLSVELGPGLLENIYDGIQRPLSVLEEKAGPFITRGIVANALDRERKWNFEPVAKPGDKVGAGDVLGEVQETSLVRHKIMVPPAVKEATVESIESGEFTVTDTVVKLQTASGVIDVQMMEKWPIREPRPVREKLVPETPLVTGQRVIDTFFPVVKGGTSAVPGPFGAGKTVIQHQIAKWADADIIIFIGCGERGNEMTDVTIEFPELKDPKTGDPLMRRTVLVANTSNMPVAAREASVYTGITIAEYFRDMGYDVALTADSTSRWAEALREISGRLGEMPGEEGYPAYLGSRTASFYERAGNATCLGSEGRQGSLTVTGAVSPPGGDLSEPVTQNTLRVVKVFWGLEATLANRRHFPSVNWLTSYSLYIDKVDAHMAQNVGQDWPELRAEAMKILQEEASLQEIVRLVGVEALSKDEQLLLDTARSLREDFLQQNAFMDEDTFTSLKKQYYMLKSILTFHRSGLENLKRNVELEQITGHDLKERIAKAKLVDESKLDELDALIQEIPNTLQALTPAQA